jgi:hypothetical protein
MHNELKSQFKFLKKKKNALLIEKMKEIIWSEEITDLGFSFS